MHERVIFRGSPTNTTSVTVVSTIAIFKFLCSEKSALVKLSTKSIDEDFSIEHKSRKTNISECLFISVFDNEDLTKVVSTSTIFTFFCSEKSALVKSSIKSIDENPVYQFTLTIFPHRVTLRKQQLFSAIKEKSQS